MAVTHCIYPPRTPQQPAEVLDYVNRHLAILEDFVNGHLADDDMNLIVARVS